MKANDIACPQNGDSSDADWRGAVAQVRGQEGIGDVAGSGE
jgi:hypothetical protein